MELNNNSKKKQSLMDIVLYPKDFIQAIIFISIFSIAIISHLSYLFYKNHQLSKMEEEIETEVTITGKFLDERDYVYYLVCFDKSRNVNVGGIDVDKLVYDMFNTGDTVTLPIEKYKLSLKGRIEYTKAKPRTWLHAIIFLLAIGGMFWCLLNFKDSFRLKNGNSSSAVGIIKYGSCVLAVLIISTYIIYWLN